MMLEHIQAQTLHARRGTLKNVFTYGVDYVLTDLGAQTPWVMSRNRFNLWSLWDHRLSQNGLGRWVVRPILCSRS